MKYAKFLSISRQNGGAVIPLTVSGGWRGIVDVFAAGFDGAGSQFLVRKNAYNKLMDLALAAADFAGYTDQQIGNALFLSEL